MLFRSDAAQLLAHADDPGFSGPACATNVDDCASLSCGSGTCVDEIGRAHCSCPTGTGGASCNVPADDCSPSPCVRGTCVLNASAFGSCTCPAGFTGTYCEQSVDDCAAATCANGSRCQDGDSTYTCVGCVGYTGPGGGRASNPRVRHAVARDVRRLGRA